MQIGSRVSARGRGSGGQELCAGCTMESVHLFASNTEATLCACMCVNQLTSVCFFPLSPSLWLPHEVEGENDRRNSCASWRKHIGQLRQRLCVARLCVWLIESQRQPLTALRLRTLLVITHKSLFPCIGSSAQLRPHKQST